MGNDDQYRVLDTSSEEPEPAQVAGQGAATKRTISRRELLKRAGTAMAGGLVTGSLSPHWNGALPDGPAVAEASALPARLSSSGKIPFSLIIDDGSPVDPLFYEIPGYETPFLVPRAFTQRVA